MAKRIPVSILVAATVLLACSCELATTAPDPGPVYLLGIGLNYHGTDTTYLEGPLNDERELGAAIQWMCEQEGRLCTRQSLVQCGGVLLSPDPYRPIYAYDSGSEALPTKETILERLERFSALTTDDSLFVFTFSGHGYADGSLVVAPDNGRGEIFAEDGTVDSRSLLSVDQVLRILETMEGTVLMIVDSCYCGSFVRESETSVSLTENPDFMQDAFVRFFSPGSESPSVFVLAATGADNTSKEPLGTSHPHGYFTAALLEGLGWNEGACISPPAGNLGAVTLDDLYAYVHAHQDIPTEGKAKWEYQHPRISGGWRSPVLFRY
jgi:hypothetical protein